MEIEENKINFEKSDVFSLGLVILELSLLLKEDEINDFNQSKIKQNKRKNKIFKKFSEEKYHLFIIELLNKIIEYSEKERLTLT